MLRKTVFQALRVTSLVIFGPVGLMRNFNTRGEDLRFHWQCATFFTQRRSRASQTLAKKVANF